MDGWGERTSRATEGLSSSRVNSVAANPCQQKPLLLRKLLLRESAMKGGWALTWEGAKPTEMDTAGGAAPGGGVMLRARGGGGGDGGREEGRRCRCRPHRHRHCRFNLNLPRVIRATTTKERKVGPREKRDIPAADVRVDGARSTGTWDPLPSDPAWLPRPSIKSEPEATGSAQSKLGFSSFFRQPPPNSHLNLLLS